MKTCHRERSETTLLDPDCSAAGAHRNDKLQPVHALPPRKAYRDSLKKSWSSHPLFCELCSCKIYLKPLSGHGSKGDGRAAFPAGRHFLESDQAIHGADETTDHATEALILIENGTTHF